LQATEVKNLGQAYTEDIRPIYILG